jgi:hypothetical protein
MSVFAMLAAVVLHECCTIVSKIVIDLSTQHERLARQLVDSDHQDYDSPSL